MTRWTIIFLLTAVFSSLLLRGQTNSEITKNLIYVGGGRQGLTYIKYERLAYYAGWTQTIVNLGVGGIPGDAEYGIPRTNKIMPQVGQLFGYKIIFIEIGIEPTINFYGKTTYTDLNAIVGLRYQSRTKQLQGLFFQAGYNPRLYYTYNSGGEAPFYFGLGLNF